MIEGLTQEEQATNHETWRHIHRVQYYLLNVITNLQKRLHTHDQSKLATPEVELFTEYTEKLKDVTYGSAEYTEFLGKLKPALDHHYANNRHHPEHWKSGIEDMTLLDLVEMLCDWKAASERHNDGNIRKSIEINTERFNMSPQLRRIFENTVDEILI
jgi:hypothetical protein